MADLSVSWRQAAVAHVTPRHGAAAPDFGAPWPAPNRMSQSAAFILASIGPNAALAIGETADGQWLDGLRAQSAAAVVDQSGAYRIVRVQGAVARDLLAGGVFIDLDLEAFPAGSTAAVRCGHIAVTLVRRAEDVFEVLVPRSYAESFVHWMRAAAVMRNFSLGDV